MEKILRFGIYVIFLLPLLVVPRLFSPFVFPKVIVFRIIIEVMLLIYLLLILKDKRYLPRFNLIFVSLTIFIGTYLLTSITGTNFYQSFWGNLERMGGFFTIFHFWIFFVILISIFKTKEDWLKLFKFSIFISFFIVLYAAFDQKLGIGFTEQGDHRTLYGSLGNPAFLGGYLLFHIFLALIFALHKNISKGWRILFIIIAGLESIVLFFTRVRGAILALVIGFFLLVLLMFIRRVEFKKIVISICVLLLIFIILGAIFWKTNFSNEFLKTETIQTRLWGWQAGLKGWQERPLLGWGPENFNLIFNKYFNPLFFETSESENQWDRAHNIILELGSTMGLVGLASYLFILAAVFYFLIRAFRKYPETRLILGVITIILVVHFIHNLFIFDSFSNYILFFSLLGFVCVLTDKKKTSQDSQYRPRGINFYAVTILLIIFSILIYQTNIKPVLANSTAFKATALFLRKNTYEKSLDYYQKAFDYQTFIKFHIRKRLASLVIRKSEQAELDGKLQKGFQLAIKELRKSIKEDSLNSQNYLYLGALYNRLARLGDKSYLNETEWILAEAIKLSPNRQQILFELGELKLIQKDYTQALQIFQQAFNLNLDSEESLWHLGLAKIESGKTEEGINNTKRALIEYSYSKLHSKLLALVNYLAREQGYEKIIALYELAVQYSHPARGQTYASLAATYAAVGELEKAIENARKAAEIDPSFQEEAEMFIQSLLK